MAYPPVREIIHLFLVSGLSALQVENIDGTITRTAPQQFLSKVTCLAFKKNSK